MSSGLQAQTAHAEDLLCVGVEGKREGGCSLASAARAKDVSTSSCGTWAKLELERPSKDFGEQL